MVDGLSLSTTSETLFSSDNIGTWSSFFLKLLGLPKNPVSTEHLSSGFPLPNVCTFSLKSDTGGKGVALGSRGRAQSKHSK